MADEVYSFEIAAEISKARKAIEAFAKDSQKNLDKINFNTTISAVVDGFRAVGAVAKPAIDLIKSLGKEALAQALEAEEAQTKLANALRITGDYSADAVKDFEQLASKIQRTTTFTDDQVLSSAALAKQYKLTNKETEQAIEVAVDLAARMGIDLESATQKVAQSFNGFVDKGLAKAIPGLKNLSKEALAGGAALELIRTAVDGSAEALGNTFGGAATKAGNAFSDILETIGKFVTQNPVVIAGIKEIQKAFEAMNADLQANGDSIRSLVSDGFILLVQAAPLVIRSFQFISDTVNAVILRFRQLTAIASDPGALFSSDEARVKRLTDQLDAIGEAFGDSVNKTDDLFEPLIKNADSLAKRISAAATATKTLKKEIQNVQSGSGKNARLADIFPKEEVDKQIQQLKDAQQKIRDITKGAIEGATKEPLQGIISFAITGQNELTKAKNDIDSTINSIKNSKDIPEALKAQAIGFAEEAKKGLVKSFGAAQAAGLLANVVKGAEGAKKLVTSAIGAAADALLPGIGGAVSEIAGELAQGPEHVKEMVQQFAQAIPGIVENIAKAIPTLIIELQKAIPQIVKGLVDALPEIIQAFIDGLPQIIQGAILLMPQIAIALVKGIITNIPQIVTSFAKEFLKIPGQFLQMLLDGLKDFLSDATGGVLGGSKGRDGKAFGGGEWSLGRGALAIGTLGGSEVFNTLGDLLGFAEGGTTARNPMFSGDRALAKIGDNETVIDSELTDWLRQVKAGGGNFGGPKEIKLYVGHQQFARAMFDSRTSGYQT